MDMQLPKALLLSVRDGTYPESEFVLTKEIEKDDLSASLKLAREAASELQLSLAFGGANNTSEIDEWINQAKRLQADITHSKRIAREIIEQHQAGQKLSAKVEDERARLQFLQKEITFNETVTSSLHQISALHGFLLEAEASLASGSLLKVSAGLGELAKQVKRLPSRDLASSSNERLLRIRSAVIEGLTKAADSMIMFEQGGDRRSVAINRGEHPMLGVSLEHLLRVLEDLHAVDKLQHIVSRKFEEMICRPALSHSINGSRCSLDGTSYRLILSTEPGPNNDQDPLQRLLAIFDFLQSQLPKALSSAIGSSLSEGLVQKLISEWLTPSIPLNLSDFHNFSRKKTDIRYVADLLVTNRWPGHRALVEWIENLSPLWVEARRARSLDAVREVLRSPRGPNKEVKRTECRDRGEERDLFLDQTANSNTANLGLNAVATVAVSGQPTNTEDEDLSAWDLEEDIDAQSESSYKMEASNVSLRADQRRSATENRNQHDSSDEADRKSWIVEAPTNGVSEDGEVTLTETYRVTDIPEQLRDIVERDLDDAAKMNDSTDQTVYKASAASDLRNLFPQTIAMFRALAPSHYSSSMLNGNMQLYNDSIYAAELLRETSRTRGVDELLAECKTVDRLAASAYGKEMNAQRIILGDLMDGAQGFVGSTSFPHSEECEKAVRFTSDHLRTLYEGWKAVLSRSVLLQSLGSLLSTVIEKMIKDIEDMDDISLEESQRLVALCGHITALEDLFSPARSAHDVDITEQKNTPLTAVYVPHWLRFQYLINILESSLVDIKYLWTEGELGLEFTADEVIDLMEALFAESSHRRSAIAEIRRTSGA